MSTQVIKNCKLTLQIPALQYGYLAAAAAACGMELGTYLVFLDKNAQALPCPAVARERVGEPKLVREVLPEVVGSEELAPVMELVDDLELGLREPEEEGRDE